MLYEEAAKIPQGEYGFFNLDYGKLHTDHYPYSNMKDVSDAYSEDFYSSSKYRDDQWSLKDLFGNSNLTTLLKNYSDSDITKKPCCHDCTNCVVPQL